MFCWASWIARSLIVVVPVLFAVGCNKDERPAVQNAFDAFQAALASKDGQKAVTLLNQASVDYYGDLLQLATTAGPDELMRRPFGDRMTIAMVRSRIDLAYARKLTPEQFFMYIVQEGWYGSDQLKGGVIENLTVEGDHASADFRGLQGSSAIPYELSKENGVWKNDLKSLIAVVSRGSASMMSSPEEENDFILMALAQKTGKPIPSSIWDKPKLK